MSTITTYLWMYWNNFFLLSDLVTLVVFTIIIIVASILRKQSLANSNGVGSELEVSKSYVELRLARDGSMAHWGDQFLPVRGKQFDILYKLARRPGEIVLHGDLYGIIDSEYHKDHLLRQYIASIRKAFPLPYSDPHHQNGIIKTRKMEGYYLNLSSDQVEIV